MLKTMQCFLCYVWRIFHSLMQNGAMTAPKVKTSRQAKTSNLMIYMSPELQQSLRRAAEIRGSSVSDLVRLLVFNHIADTSKEAWKGYSMPETWPEFYRRAADDFQIVSERVESWKKWLTEHEAYVKSKGFTLEQWRDKQVEEIRKTQNFQVPSSDS